jgi:hypothetical protein
MAAELCAHGAREIAHRQLRIIDGDHRDALAPGWHAPAPRHDDARDARRRGLGGERESVDALAR